MKKFEKKTSTNRIITPFYKKTALVALLLALSLPLSQKSLVITKQKKAETKELFTDLTDCSLTDINLIEYIIDKQVITTHTLEQLLSKEDKKVIDSLGIGEGLTAAALYNEQFRDNWIAFEKEFITVLDTLGVEKELAPRFHRHFSNKIYHNTPNHIIPTLLPEDYSRIISITKATINEHICDFFAQSGIILPTKKKITKRRFSPEIENRNSTKKQHTLLEENNIHLRSSQLHHKENGLSYEHGRTCIIGLNPHTIGFMSALSKELGEIWISGGTERGHTGERYCIAGKSLGRSLTSAKKLHGAGNVIDIALDGVTSLQLFEFFPHQQGRFTFLGYTGTYSWHSYGGQKNTKQSFKKQFEKFSSSMHLHIYIESGPTSSSHSSPSDTIPVHQQHREVQATPST